MRRNARRFFSPFEFEITEFICEGKNKLRIDLYNDYIYMGNADRPGSQMVEGEKLYAATGPGWDDPAVGWHHCPPGMGIYNRVFIEERNKVHISDIFVRPLLAERKAEVWVEIRNTAYDSVQIELNLSLFGQNFKETVFSNLKFIPKTIQMVGLGDSLTEASIRDELGKGIPQPLKHGINLYKVIVDIDNPKLWDNFTPYLYQIQVGVLINGQTMDVRKRQFGMRSFRQDIESTPKGMFYLNNRKVRLRGANTMGFEQQNIINDNIEQLIDDILLAKLCNMNFLRLTQRPVQEEIYDYCDKLGLMTQTDLPLFGCMRRTAFCEGIKQAEEMEKLIRSHPCNVIITYINEPFPNANNEPHRHFLRNELEQFFTACDLVIKLNNPDRVIKHVDGDYDPPTESMPDNHCYPMWYNGHGIDIGRLHKGYWLPVKPGWYYGCGEYGAEGLDFVELMLEKYPKEWLKEPFNPTNIVNAQTGDFYYFFYDKQDSIEKWVSESQRFQAFATRIMISNAIHLFIDAWPSGWMKTIMDCKRNPKPAYFAYRNALEPVLLSLRTDKFTYFCGEKISIETYICNDTQLERDSLTVRFELYSDKQLIMSGEKSAYTTACDVSYIANCEFTIKDVDNRQRFELCALLLDKNGDEITHNSVDIEVFRDVNIDYNDDIILIEKLEEGEYEIAGEIVKVKNCGMLPLHFVSRKTGHAAIAEFEPKDFSYWYDKKYDMITPIIEATFTAEGFKPILISGNQNENGDWDTALACGVKEYEGKKYVICQVDLKLENPIAKRFLRNIYEL